MAHHPRSHLHKAQTRRWRGAKNAATAALLRRDPSPTAHLVVHLYDQPINRSQEVGDPRADVVEFAE